MFKWLVECINSKLGAKRMVEGQGEIRILDVYGFENLEHNSMELRCRMKLSVNSPALIL